MLRVCDFQTAIFAGESKERLVKAGFVQLSERETWNLNLGGKYFFTRNHSTILAFAIGKKYACDHSVPDV